MKLLWTILALPALTAVAAVAGQTAQMQNDMVTVAVDRVQITSIQSDRAQFDVLAHVTAARNLTIKRVRFEQMRLQGIPVYLGPMEERLQLEKGTAMSLPPIPLTIYYRDLHSLDPLANAVRDGTARVQGKARIDLDVSMLERAATGQWTVRADVPVDISAPVDIPRGSAGRTAAVATLHAAQAAVDLGGSVFGALGGTATQSDEDLRTQYTPSLLVAESHYSLDFKDKGHVDIVVRGLGIRVSADKFLVAGEMLEPWKYDADAATALQTGSAHMVDGSADLLVWPAGGSLDPASARSQKQGLIQVVRKPGGSERTRVPGGKQGTEIRLARRDSDDNLAVLRFTRAEDNGAAVPLAPEDARKNGSWDRLTLFRIDSKGALEALSTPATRKDNRILLEDPVDDSAFGSLLICAQGGLGMVQDERSGVILQGQW